jgi:hypothetical protein
MSLTHNSQAAQMLEVGTCPTSAFDEVLHLAEEVPGTKTASLDPVTGKDQKSKNDVNKETEQMT